jgi:hypothetical protein
VTESWIVDNAILAAGYVRAGVNYSAGTKFTATINGAPATLATKESGTDAELVYLLWNGKVHLTNGSQYTPALGHVIKLVYVGQFPFTVVYPDPWVGPEPPIDEVLSAPEATDYASGYAMAVAEQQRRVVIPREFDFTSLTPGWSPGQSLAIIRSDLATNDTGYITAVDIAIDKDGIWSYRVKVTVGPYKGSKLNFIRNVSRGSRGTVTAVGGAPTVVEGPATGSAAPFYMGGSRNTSLSPPASQWTSIVNYNVFVAPVSGLYRASIELYGNTTIYARLESAISGLAYVPISSPVTSGTPVTVTFDVGLSAGNSVRFAVRGTGGDLYAASATITAL